MHKGLYDIKFHFELCAVNHVFFSFILQVFPNGEEGEDNSDYVAVFLTSRRQEDLEVKYDFSVQKADGACWGRIGNTFKKFSPEQNSWGYGKAFSKAKLLEKANELLPNGRLTIVCNLEIYYSDRHTEGKKQRLEFKTEETPSLGDNLERGLPTAQFSDVTLVCDGRRFDAHKFILSSRSDVFKAMFSHEGTTESTSNEVVIKDLEPEVLEHLLKFIYSDKAESSLPALAGGLLTAADKYNIPRLKAICEETMCENIDVSNAAEVLGLAYLHEAKILQTVAVNFVTNNMAKVAETPGWKTITESQPKIMNEVLMSLTSKK